jgi:hypothetical protein
MSDFTMDLNNINNLSASISALREARTDPSVSKEIKILITWKDDDKNTHAITVFANMPNIWVTGFQANSGDKIEFSAAENKYVNCEGVSCRLTLDDIRQNLRPLELAKTKLYYEDNCKNLKTATFMCIFITSEIIRNELLEIIVRHQSHSNKGSCNWNNLIEIYRNWASDSKLLYVKNPEVIPTILLKDVQLELTRLERSNDTNCDFYRRYHDLVKAIES